MKQTILHFTRHMRVIKADPIFKNLTSDEHHTLLMLMNRAVWKAGTVSGRLKAYQINSATGREFTISMLSKGDIFNVLHLLYSEAYGIHLQTLDDI